MLTGTAAKRIRQCTNSLSIEIERIPDVKIINEGAKKQWITQAAERVTATLSEFIWVFNIAISYFPMLLITTIPN